MMRGLVAVVVMLAMVAFGCGEKTSEGTSPVIDSMAQLPGYKQLDSITKLLDRSPNNTDLLNFRAKLFLSAGELNFALADVGRAILIDSSKAEYFLTIAEVYFQRNEPQRCLKSLEVARRLAPDNTEPLYRLAQFNLYLNKHQESIDLANEMLRIDPQDDRPFLIKALCFKDMGDTTKALENYMLAAEQNPDNFDVQVELGILNWGRKSPMAEAFLKNALAIRPDAIEAWYALGMVYQNSGRYEKAMQSYTKIIEVDSTYRSAYFNMGYIHFQHLKQYDDALVQFDRAVAISPNYHEAIYMRGACYEAKGDKEKAKREYTYALQLAPDYGKAAKGMTRLLR